MWMTKTVGTLKTCQPFSGKNSAKKKAFVRREIATKEVGAGT